MRNILKYAAFVAVLSSPACAETLTVPTIGQTNASWTPTDGSTAGLTFTGVSASYTQIGNMVFTYSQLTYPTTADGTAASIAGFPVAAANANYASTTNIVEVSTTLAFPVIIQKVKNGTKAILLNGFTNAAVTNVQLTGATIDFILVYPAN